VLFILVCFGIGIFIRLCLRWTKIPYTAMLLVSTAGPQQHQQYQPLAAVAPAPAAVVDAQHMQHAQPQQWQFKL
jgi:hypothetical protein